MNFLSLYFRYCIFIDELIWLKFASKQSKSRGRKWGYRCYKGDGYIASTKLLCFCLNLSILKPKRTKYQATKKTWVAMEISVPSTDGKMPTYLLEGSVRYSRSSNGNVNLSPKHPHETCRESWLNVWASIVESGWHIKLTIIVIAYGEQSQICGLWIKKVELRDQAPGTRLDHSRAFA